MEGSLVFDSIMGKPSLKMFLPTQTLKLNQGCKKKAIQNKCLFKKMVFFSLHNSMSDPSSAIRDLHFTELKTLEWDILNPDRLINLS